MVFSKIQAVAVALLVFPVICFAVDTNLEAAFTLTTVVNSVQDTTLGIWKAFLDHLPYLGAATIALFATWGVARLANLIAAKILSRSWMRPSLRDLIKQLINFAIWILGLLLAAMIVFPGLTPTKAIGGLGVASLAVGFAFKEIFENFFAGVLLLWRFPFENDDWIECEGILGRVEDITIRMTIIRKPTDEIIVVPNSFLVKNPVRVLTNKDVRRVSIMTGVAYDEDVETSINVISDAVSSCDSVNKSKPPQVFANGFGASSIDIEVAWWTDPSPLGERKSRGEVVTAIKAALDNAGIEIPFPYRTLTFKEPMKIINQPVETADQ